jgi:hypothetical protein
LSRGKTLYICKQIKRACDIWFLSGKAPLTFGIIMAPANKPKNWLYSQTTLKTLQSLRGSFCSRKEKSGAIFAYCEHF